MTPKSNSIECDMKEATETSAAVISLPSGEKRKADSLNSEDSSESDEGSESEEEIEDRFKWGYDSFEGREYHSSEQDEYSDKEHEMQWRYFNRQVIETEGFFESSDKFPKCRFGGIGIIPDLEATAGDFGTVRELCTKMTLKCITKYNKENKKDIMLQKILRANFKPSSMSKFYITFLAKEFDDECSNAHNLVEYHAKAVWLYAETIYPLFCRPSPKKHV